jgi:type VI secretion system secreted protein Hcp
MSSHPLRRRRLAVERLEDRTLMAADMYMKINGIDGEVTDKGHKNEIDVLSWSWGTAHSGGGGGTGKASVSDITVSKMQDSASTGLAKAALSGKILKKVEIHFEDRDSDTPLEYYRYELKNVFITSYQISGGGGGGDPLPLESISMNFEEVTWEYKELDGKKVKGRTATVDAKGPDINRDGQPDPLYFNFASIADLDRDGDLDLVVAENPNNPNTVVADLTGDGEPDLTPPPGPGQIALEVEVHRIGQPSQVRVAVGDVNGDGLIDTAFAFDLDGDGLADILAGLGA